MLPTGKPMAGMAAKLVTLRAAVVSPELVTAIDLVLLGRDVRRVANLPEGPARRAAGAAVRARLDAVLQQCEPTPTPLQGLHGEGLEVMVELWRIEAPQQLDPLVARVRRSAPLLADRLERARRR